MNSIDYFIAVVITFCFYFLPIIFTRFVVVRKKLSEKASATFILIFSLIYPVLWFLSIVLFLPAAYSADLGYAFGSNFIVVIIALVLYGMLGYKILHGTLKKDPVSNSEQ